VRIVFFGVGALGSHAAVLCRSLDADLALVDFDRVEDKNLLAQAYVKQSIGRNKAEALRLQLLNLHGVRSQAYPVRVEHTNVATLADGADLLVDCFDNIASRKVLSDHASSTGTPLVHAAISADGRFGLVRWDKRFAPDAEDAEGEATCEAGEHLPFIGLVSAALARVIQEYVQNGRCRDVMVTASDVTTTWHPK
jgi:molybdopterin/thiamine biosynthesis adenylyltransferase